MSGHKDRPLVVGPDSPAPPFPIYLQGPVIKGFGRGSKELGIPTGTLFTHPDVNNPANLSDQHVQDYLTETGIYYGYAKVCSHEDERIVEMVMSVGYNPFYNNTVRSAEVHIMCEYEADFYGKEMKVIVLGYIRPEYDYVSKEALIEDIMIDIRAARESLKRPAYEAFKNVDFWNE